MGNDCITWQGCCSGDYVGSDAHTTDVYLSFSQRSYSPRSYIEKKCLSGVVKTMLSLSPKTIPFDSTLQGESESEVAQSCLTLCDPMACSLPCFLVHGVFQARVLGWGTISYSRRSSRPRDWTRLSRIVGRSFTVWATFMVGTVYSLVVEVALLSRTVSAPTLEL